MADSKTTKPILLGKFSPLKAGTSLARICAAALPGKYTVAEIAKAAGLPEDKVVRRLRRRFAAHGIGITLVLPPGVPAAHTRRAAACSHHHRPSSVDVNRADLRRASMVVLVPENRPPNDKALSAERRIAFLEPASLRPWIPLPARGPFQSSSASSGRVEPSARRPRLEHMGRSAGQTEMDAVADLREEICRLGAHCRKSQ
jgi:hypothetical protein